MVVADSQPDRKDKYNHFMDDQIMVAPLAHCGACASEDTGVKDIAEGPDEHSAPNQEQVVRESPWSGALARRRRRVVSK
jgi:hypothetical protein